MRNFIIQALITAVCVLFAASISAASGFVWWPDSTYTANDTTYHFCHAGDSIITATDTTILAVSDLKRTLRQHTRIEGTTDSVVSIAFPIGKVFAGVAIAATIPHPSVIQCENIGGTADSMFTTVSLLLSSHPTCGSQPDSNFSYTHCYMTKATATASGQDTGTPVIFNMKCPAQCGKLVVKGTGDNAIGTPGADYGAGSNNGTLFRAWVLME